MESYENTLEKCSGVSCRRRQGDGSAFDADPVHMFISIPLKYAVAQVIGL
jgi:hypothetical protein